MAWYEGTWKGGEYNGNGKLVSSQWTYDGEWVNGRMHGHGVRTDAAGTILEQGTWVDGKLVATDDATTNNTTTAAQSPGGESHAVLVD